MVKGNGKKQKRYVDRYQEIEEKIPLKADSGNLKTTLKILDVLMENHEINIREALEILEDARIILMETVYP